MWLLKTVRESALVTAAFCFTACIATAQSVVEVGNETECDVCDIRVERLFQVGGLDGPGLHAVSPWSHVAMDEGGRLLVAGARVPEISVFNSTGDFVAVVGGEGQGPGEFQSITTIAAAPGRLHVFDRGNGRVVLDQNLNEIERHAVPRPITSALALPSGMVLIGADIPSASALGHPLHLLTPDGQFTSFGGTPSSVKGRGGVLVLGADGRGGVWAVNERTNVASYWRPEESMSEYSLVRRFGRNSAWFDEGMLGPNTWPFSIVEAVRVDSSGVWVAGNAPDPNFTPLVGIQPIPETPFDQVFDGWLEVFDPETGRILVRQRVDEMVIGFVGPEGLLATYRESEEGVPFITVWRANVVRSH